MVTVSFTVTRDQLLTLIRAGVVTSPVNNQVLMRNWLGLTPDILKRLQELCQTDHTEVITESVITPVITDANVLQEKQLDLITENPGICISSSPLVQIQEKSTVSRINKNHADGFEAFWKAYPKKVGKLAAKRKWVQLAMTAETVAQVMQTLHWQTRSDQWRKDGGQFIPNPATYLHQGRWHDEPAPRPTRNGSYTPSGATNGSIPYTDHCPHTPSCSDGRWRCIQRQQLEWVRAHPEAL